MKLEDVARLPQNALRALRKRLDKKIQKLFPQALQKLIGVQRNNEGTATLFFRDEASKTAFSLYVSRKFKKLQTVNRLFGTGGEHRNCLLSYNPLAQISDPTQNPLDFLIEELPSPFSKKINGYADRIFDGFNSKEVSPDCKNLANREPSPIDRNELSFDLASPPPTKKGERKFNFDSPPVSPYPNKNLHPYE